MTGVIEEKPAPMGVGLPSPAKAVANCLGYVRTGNLLMMSGQLPLVGGKLAAIGLAGRDSDLAASQQAAHAYALNVLAQARAVLGDLDQILRLVKVTVFVASISTSGCGALAQSSNATRPSIACRRRRGPRQ